MNSNDSKDSEFKRQFNWTLSKDLVQKYLKREISESEFLLFCYHFEEHYKNQFVTNLEWLSDEWDEVKTWDIFSSQIDTNDLLKK